MDYKIVKQEDAPIEIKKWLDENITIECKKIFTISDMSYVVLTRGEKTTGGYGIKIVCKEKEDIVEILFKYHDPQNDQIIIQTITFPVIIVKFKKTIKEILIIQDNTI